MAEFVMALAFKHVSVEIGSNVMLLQRITIAFFKHVTRYFRDGVVSALHISFTCFYLYVYIRFCGSLNCKGRHFELVDASLVCRSGQGLFLPLPPPPRWASALPGQQARGIKAAEVQ